MCTFLPTDELLSRLDGALICPIAHVPADLTKVDRCVDQRPPVVGVLAQIDGRTARHLFLEDTSFISH